MSVKNQDGVKLGTRLVGLATVAGSILAFVVAHATLDEDQLGLPCLVFAGLCLVGGVIGLFSRGWMRFALAAIAVLGATLMAIVGYVFVVDW